MRSISAREERSRQAVLRNAEAHHAAGLGPSLEDRDVVTQQRQIVRGGEPGGAGTDHRHTAARTAGRRWGGAVKRQRQVAGVAVALAAVGREQAILRIGPHRLHAVLLGDVALEGANRNRRVNRAAAAGVLAWGGADPPAHRGQRVGRAGDQKGVFKTPLGNQLDIAAGVGRDGTARLTFHLRLPMSEVGQQRADPHSPSLCAACAAGGTGGMTGVIRRSAIANGRCQRQRQRAFHASGGLNARACRCDAAKSSRSRGKLRCQKKTPAPMIGVIRRRASHR